MSLKRECEHLRELNTSLRKQIELLERLLEHDPNIIRVDGLMGVIPSAPRVDSWQFRGWPARCSDSSGGTCVYESVPIIPGTADVPSMARCRTCGHPPLTNTTVFNSPNLTSEGNHS